MTRFRLLSLTLLAAAPCLSQTTAAVKQTSTTAATQPKAGVAPAVKVAEKPIVPFTVWQLRPGDSTETQVTPVQLNPSGYWIMAYVDLKSPASQNLLTQLQTLATTRPTVNPKAPATIAALTPPSLIDASKLVIIAARATGAELSQFELGYPGLAAAAWTHDLKGAAAHLLEIRGTPHLFGMREGEQHWQLAESLKPGDLQPVLTTWSAFNQLPKNKLTRRKPTPPPNLAKTVQATATASTTPALAPTTSTASTTQGPPK